MTATRVRIDPLISPRGLVCALALALALGAGACTSRNSGSGGDGAIHSDAGADALVTRSFVFVPDDDGKTSPAIALSQTAATDLPGGGTEIELAVVARGVAKLQGVALRVVLPAGVTLSGSGAAGPEFGPAKAVFRVAQSGSEIWLGAGRRGFSGVDAASVERTVATFKIKVLRGTAAALPFREHHGLVLDSETGKKVDVTWLAGRLEPK